MIMLTYIKGGMISSTTAGSSKLDRLPMNEFHASAHHCLRHRIFALRVFLKTEKMMTKRD